MKFLRLSFLLLLAVLLPVRGAVAAAMLCEGAEATRVQAVAVADEHMDDIAMPDMAGMPCMDEEASQPDTGMHDHAHDHAHAADHGDKCNLCATACAMTPLLGGLSMSWLPPAATKVAFPDCHAPATSFVSVGQERPPRTI